MRRFLPHGSVAPLGKPAYRDSASFFGRIERMISDQPQPVPRIILLSGPRQVGKSTLCRKLVARLHENTVGVAGFLTIHTGSHDLEVMELHSGEQYPLTLPFDDGAGAELGRFRMDGAALNRGLLSLQGALPTDVLIVDELGPLEFRLGRGWLPVLNLLRADCCHVAVLVVRPELLAEALEKLPGPVTTVIYVTLENRDRMLGTLTWLTRDSAQGWWSDDPPTATERTNPSVPECY